MLVYGDLLQKASLLIKEAFCSPNIDKTYIVGGIDIISDTVSNSFSNPYRINGDNKYQRNIIDPNIKAGKDYLSILASGFEAKNYTVNGNIYSQIIGGKNFDMLDIKKVSEIGIEVHQRIYCTVIKNFALSFILTYADADSLNNLNNVMNTIKFTN